MLIGVLPIIKHNVQDSLYAASASAYLLLISDSIGVLIDI